METVGYVVACSAVPDRTMVVVTVRMHYAGLARGLGQGRPFVDGQRVLFYLDRNHAMGCPSQAADVEGDANTCCAPCLVDAFPYQSSKEVTFRVLLRAGSLRMSEQVTSFRHARRISDTIAVA